jgi:hypothetical protein
MPLVQMPSQRAYPLNLLAIKGLLMLKSEATVPQLMKMANTPCLEVEKANEQGIYTLLTCA